MAIDRRWSHGHQQDTAYPEAIFLSANIDFCFYTNMQGALQFLLWIYVTILYFSSGPWAIYYGLLSYLLRLLLTATYYDLLLLLLLLLFTTTTTPAPTTITIHFCKSFEFYCLLAFGTGHCFLSVRTAPAILVRSMHAGI